MIKQGGGGWEREEPQKFLGGVWVERITKEMPPWNTVVYQGPVSRKSR